MAGGGLEGLESGEVYVYCWEQEEEAYQDQEEDELPGPAEPCAVGDAGYAEAADEYAAGGGQHVGEAVAELEGEHGGLPREVDEVGELRHDGHGECCFGGA